MNYITEIYIPTFYVCICCNCFVLLALKTYSFAKDLPNILQSIVSQTLSFQEDNGMFSGCYVCTLNSTLQMFAGIYRDFAGKLECGDFTFMGIACIPEIPVIFEVNQKKV